MSDRVYNSLDEGRSTPTNPHTLRGIQKLKTQGKKFAMITAYDASFAKIADEQGMEVILVGDSLGMVVQGHSSTTLVSLAEMEYHTKMVRRGVKNAVLMVDMPFGYGTDKNAAVSAAMNLMRAGADLVKLEVNQDSMAVVEDFGKKHIPFCTHLGLLPQQALKQGYKVKGRDNDEVKSILDLADYAEECGTDMLLLECVVDDLAKEVTRKAKVPVVGIGCGKDTDAQVLVVYDLLGMNGKPARFVKDFMAEAGSIQGAISLYRKEVLNGKFPAPEHSYPK